MAWVGKRPARRLGGMADVLTMASDLGFHLPVSPGSSLIIVIIIIILTACFPSLSFAIALESTILGNSPCINQSECIIVSSFEDTAELSDNGLGNPTRGPFMYRKQRNRRGNSPKHEERGGGRITHSLMLACLGDIEDCHSCSGLYESFNHHKRSSIAFTTLLEFYFRRKDHHL